MASISSPFFSPSKLSSGPRLRPASAKRRSLNGSDADGGGFGLVDESMIVLRKRIHEMEVAERNYEPPTHWSEWEKRYYTAYGSDVCAFAGWVQAQLLRTRPGLAIGMAVLMAVSVPTSAVLIWVHLAAMIGG